MRPALRVLLPLWLVLALPAAAQDAPIDEQPVMEDSPKDELLARRLGYRPAIDVPITALTWGFWLGTEAFKSEVAPDRCNWCEPNSTDWAVRNALKWENTKGAQRASDVLLFGVAPAAARATTLTLAGADGRMEEVPWDALLILESAGVAAALNQSVKLVIGRERPFAYALPDAEKGLVDEPYDNNLSFYSGHATVTFALAASTATVARMRGRKGAAWAWAVGMPIAATTAYLRLAGDKHYLSDVTVGAVAGTAIGVLVPAVHDWMAFRTAGAQSSRRGGRPSAVTTSAGFVPLPGGGAGTFAMRW